MPPPIERIQAAAKKAHVSTMYGRDSACLEVESSEDPAVIYTVLYVVDQGELVASCTCPFWRTKQQWCKHIHGGMLVWDREANG